MQYLPALLQAAPEVITYSQKMYALFKSHPAWTPEINAAFEAEWIKNMGPDKPDWMKTDDEL